MRYEVVWPAFLLSVSSAVGQGKLGVVSPVADGLNWLIDHVFEWRNGLGGLLFLAALTILIVVGIFWFGRNRNSGGEPIKRAKHPPDVRGKPVARCTPAEVTQLLRSVKRVKRSSCAQYSATVLDLYLKGALLFTWEGKKLFLEPTEAAREMLPHEACLLHWIEEAKGGQRRISMTEFIRYIKKNHGASQVHLAQFDCATLSELQKKGFVLRGSYSGFCRRVTGKIPKNLFVGLIFFLLAGSAFSLYASMRGRFPLGWLTALLLLLLAVVSIRSRKSRLYLTRQGEEAAACWVAWTHKLGTAPWGVAEWTVADAFAFAVAAEKGAAVVAWVAQGQEENTTIQSVSHMPIKEAGEYARLLDMLALLQKAIWSVIRKSDGANGTTNQ